MKKNRTSSLIKNVGLFFIASFGTKFISFFLVPLYTSKLSTEVYGLVDYLSTIVSLILPILMLDISDAIMFVSFRAQGLADKQQPLLYGAKILRTSSLILVAVLAVISLVIGGTNILVYCAFILIRYILDAFHLNLLAYMRAIDAVQTITISSILTSVTMILMNLVLILWLDMGLYALLISSISGTLVSNLYCSLKVGYWRFSKAPLTMSKQQKKQMLAYSIPLIFSGLAWWVNSSLDKFFIAHYCGIGANGIYAIANKIPTLLTAVHTVIYQAMQLSVFSEMDSNDSKDYMKRLYSIYNFVMVMACSLLIILDKPMAHLLFKGEYYEAWQYVPVMLLSTAIFSVSGYVTIIASASKETKTIAAATLSGAAVNALLNWTLVPKFGLFGAIIGTASGYFVVWLVLILRAENKLDLKFSKFKSMLMYALLAVQWIILLKGTHTFVLECAIFAVLCLLNINTIRDLWGIAVSFLRSILAKLKSRH